MDRPVTGVSVTRSGTIDCCMIARAPALSWPTAATRAGGPLSMLRDPSSRLNGPAQQRQNALQGIGYAFRPECLVAASAANSGPCSFAAGKELKPTEQSPRAALASTVCVCAAHIVKANYACGRCENLQPSSCCCLLPAQSEQKMITTLELRCMPTYGHAVHDASAVHVASKYADQDQGDGS